MFLLHKFRPCLIQQMNFVPIKKRFPNICWVSKFKKQTEHCSRSPGSLPRFLAKNVFSVGSLSNENIASSLPETLGSRDELVIKLLLF